MNTSSLLDMLKSEDVENHLVAFGIIEQNVTEKNYFKLLMCYKFGKPVLENWSKEAPEALKLIKDKGGSDVTFNDLFNIISVHEVSLDEYDIFYREYSKYLTRRTHHTDVAGIEIKVNRKV